VFELCLEIYAPFATFRHFAAGSFRPTAPFFTPSAAYGLLLNLAGIEMRKDDGESAMTLIASGLPSVELAIAARQFPEPQSIYQQLHNYPVGASGKKRAPLTKGNKYNVVPARRALLSGVHGYIALRGDFKLADCVRRGLAGEFGSRYGLPFLGDSNFLPDKINPVDSVAPAHWYCVADENLTLADDQETARLTVTIDRADMSRTRSKLFAPTAQPTEVIPDTAWVTVHYGSA